MTLLGPAILEHYCRTLWFEHVEFRQEFAVYGAKVPSLFQKEGRYIFALVDTTQTKTPLPTGRTRLQELPWISFQTRLVSRDRDRYKDTLREHVSWRIEAKNQDVKLNVLYRSKKGSDYLSEDGSLKVSLIHDSQNPSLYQYHNSLMLSTAVETFNSVCEKR